MHHILRRFCCGAVAGAVMLVLFTAGAWAADAAGHEGHGGHVHGTDEPIVAPPPGPVTDRAALAEGDRALADAAAKLARGEVDAAAKAYEAADGLYTKAGSRAGRVRALLGLSAALAQNGNYDPVAPSTLNAFRMLKTAAALVDEQQDRPAAIAVQSSLGTLYTYTQKYDEASAALDRAMTLAGGAATEAASQPAADTNSTRPATDAAAAGDAYVRERAGVWNNRGNLYTAQVGQVRSRIKYSDEQQEQDKQLGDRLQDQALTAYDEAAKLASQAGDRLLEAKAMVNAAVSASRDGRAGEAKKRNADALARLADLPDGHAKIDLLLTAGRTDQEIAAADPNSRAESVRRAKDAFDKAANIAQATGDARGEMYATGYSAGLYEKYGRPEDARSLANRAVFLAQKLGDNDALYRWQWLNGRVLRRQAAQARGAGDAAVASADRDEAIAAYTRAAATLRPVFGDVVKGYGNGDTRLTFRKEIAPIYYQTADLLLRRAADPSRDAGARRQDLLDAREAIEQLKSGELADYFKDPCENVLPQKEVAEVDPHTAVVYHIPLEDRTEILLQFKGGEVVRVDPPAAVGSEQLEQVANRFRERLETRASTRYRTDGKKLYDWLIKPAEKQLQERQIDTLVFVPDGVLRTIPMAALFDGDQFLIEKYAVAVTPSLKLTESESLGRGNIKLLINALSVAKPGFDALPNVPAEVKNIQATFGNAREKTLDNAQFTFSNVRDELKTDEDFSIVHIASHGQFRGDVQDTFLLTYDDRLTIDRLQSLILPKRYGQKTRPVDLLTLSACQTAAGDDRAALGLAGVAIKAGARSAVASLWYLNDTSSVELITQFYRELAAGKSKAKALQAAQIKLLRDPDFSHPLYWAPYLVIGNWQ